MLKNYPLELAPPTLDDSISDLDRLLRCLSKSGCDIGRMSVGLKVMRELAVSMRHEDWKVTASVVKKRNSSEIVGVVPGNSKIPSLDWRLMSAPLPIVVYLVDMADGTVLAATSDHNRQAACGDDVINRIVLRGKRRCKKTQPHGACHN